MSTFLEKKGVALNEGYRAENLPPDADVVVIGNAITRGNPEAEAVLNQKLYYLSLPELCRYRRLPMRSRDHEIVPPAQKLHLQHLRRARGSRASG